MRQMRRIKQSYDSTAQYYCASDARDAAAVAATLAAWAILLSSRETSIASRALALSAAAIAKAVSPRCASSLESCSTSQSCAHFFRLFAQSPRESLLLTSSTPFEPSAAMNTVYSYTMNSNKFVMRRAASPRARLILKPAMAAQRGDPALPPPAKQPKY